MIGRVVEIAEDGRHLAALRGFMVVKSEGEEIGRVPLDDIGVVIVNAHGITYSNSLIVALAERGAGVVVCAANHNPVAWLWPVVGNHMQTARMMAQIEATRPLGKRLWQTVVQAKIEQQGAALAALGKPHGGFALLAREVRSRDPANVEAQAARRYWPILFGEDFRHDRAAGGINAMLNYGYAVLRAATARAVTGARLHPSLGIHHRNRSDAMSLADDLMEPFRPLVDLLAARLAASGRAGRGDARDQARARGHYRARPAHAPGHNATRHLPGAARRLAGPGLRIGRGQAGFAALAPAAGVTRPRTVRRPRCSAVIG